MATKVERMDLRLDPDKKELIEQAATTLGVTLSAFAITALVERARDVLAKHQSTELSRRDMEAFSSILRADEEPNAALRAAAKRLKRTRG